MAVELTALVLSGAGSGLGQALGETRGESVQRLLDARAREWAADVGGEVQVVAETSFAAALSRRAAGSGALLLVAPELPAWPARLAQELGSDLQDGCDLAIGPFFDGGAYLVALSPQAIRSPQLIGELDVPSLGGIFSLAEARGWEVGLLRTERALRRARDVDAVRADPLTDDELLRALGD